MSRRELPVGVPCGVCLARVDGWCWYVGGGPVADPVAVPCGHRLGAILAVHRAVLAGGDGLPSGAPIRYPTAALLDEQLRTVSHS